MSEIKTLKEKRVSKIQKIKSKRSLLKRPKRSYLWIAKVLNKSVQSIKKVLQELKSVRKSSKPVPWSNQPINRQCK